MNDLEYTVAVIDSLSQSGIPTLAPSFLPENVKVWVQSENGLLGMVS